MTPRSILIGMTVALLWSSQARAARAPEWVRQLRPGTADKADTTARARVVLNELRVVVPVQGRVHEIARGAVEVLTPAGVEAAQSAVYYDRKTDQVTYLRAWVVFPNGRIVEFDRSDALDFALLGPGALLSDERGLRLAAREMPAGAIFAWESEVEREPLLAQWAWRFGGPQPTQRSRFEIVLPDGAEVEAVGAPASVETTHEGTRWSWEMEHLAALKPVEFGPEQPGADRLLRVSVRNARGRAAGAEFAGWSDVGRWSESLTETQAQLDDDLRAKARTLTAGLRDPLAQARAIGEYVQRTNYVAMNLGLGLGYGYRPRSASEVLRTGYGDCKDKANLARALLRAVGQEAWLVAVYAGDRHWVRPEWPTVCQFNHCIVAFRAPPGADPDASDASSPLGPLMFFDPTDPCTLFGELPVGLRGSYAFIQSEKVDTLVRLPLEREQVVDVQRRLDARLAPDGSLEGEWLEARQGAAATFDRCLLREGAAKLRQRDQALLARASSAAGVVEWTPLTSPDSAVVRRHITIRVPHFAQASGPQIMSFAPCLLRMPPRAVAGDTARTEPVDLEPESMLEESRFRLPEGWRVDELPERERIEMPFASVEASWELKGGDLVFLRRWRTVATRLPAASYPEVVTFFAQLDRVERSRVVLVKD